MKYLLLFCLIALTLAVHPKWSDITEDYSFEQYVKDFQKNYLKQTQEYEQRKKIFEDKLKEIISHNQNSEKTWKKGINKWTDHSLEEIQSINNGLNKGMKQSLQMKQYEEYRRRFLQQKQEQITEEQLNGLPKQVDWRDKNVVSPVKDQGKCGSCWAFASVATIESHASLYAGELKVLSTQQLVECMPNVLKCGGQGGCQGAIPELVFNYVQLTGLTSEYKYPYTSYQGQQKTCSFDLNQTSPEVTLDGYIRLKENSYEDVIFNLATKGPLAINVDASNWHDYEEGVYEGCDYTKNIDINHVVVLVGYGTDKKYGDYWLVRNSWGTKWGENGYIRLRREAKPQCGTDYTPLEGTGCASGPSTQKVCGQCGLLLDVSYPLGVKVIG